MMPLYPVIPEYGWSERVLLTSVPENRQHRDTISDLVATRRLWPHFLIITKECQRFSHLLCAKRNARHGVGQTGDT